ncbi:MAG TPA: peptide-methionine (R)-S-oxide reductase [Leeuwenhoekiella sp.]|nr:peptide-methionine (R)-S-oxide reductase [Leeuwenhoekiella sp.]
MKKMMLILLVAAFTGCKGNAQQETKKEDYPVEKTASQWKAELTPQEFNVLRQSGTERAFTSDLLDNKKEGTYTCAACGNPVFEGKHKFDSGTGWPSFDRSIEGNVSFSSDDKLGYTRVEEHCSNCGSHLGHVFNDGPEQTTGKRHCINGVALNFEAN